MSPTPTPSPSPAPVFKEDDSWSQPDPGVIPLSPGHPCIGAQDIVPCILDHQQQVADELNASSTSTMSSAEFNALMDGQPSHNAAAPVAGVVLSILVLAAAAAAFIRHRRANVTSPPATAEATP